MRPSVLAIPGIAAVLAAAAFAQAPPTAGPQVGSQQATANAQPAPPQNVKLPSNSDRRKAATLFMQASGLYEKQQYEQAIELYQKAAALDPTNPDYPMAAQVARSHAATALIQQATLARTKGDAEAAQAALDRARQIDPQNPQVAQHLQQSGDDASRWLADSSAPQVPVLGAPIELVPTAATHSFHIKANQRQMMTQVFRAYGIEPTFDSSVGGNFVRLDLDDVAFAQAMRAVGLLTDTMYVPIDPHKVLVARNTRANYLQFGRNAAETVYLAGMQQNDMTEIGNIARNVFGVQQMSVDTAASTITLRGPIETLNAFNATYRDLLDGRSQVLIDVRIIQLAHTNARVTGLQPIQTVTAFNVYSEAQSILQQNQTLVQQIIASGLAAPGDWRTILGILIASGQVSSSLFSGGIVTFGGGLTQTGLAVGQPMSVHLNLNSSDSRALEDFQIRLEDGEEGTLKSGTRYPIMTSSFSGLGGAGLNIPGVSLPGNSGSLAGILSSLQGAVPNVPQFQYQDLGLVLKARPRVLRSGDVALTLDMKITALAGAAVNNVPVLANRSYAGAVTVPAGQAVVIASEVDKTESRAVSGWPGLSEIPGLNDITKKDVQKNYATLLVILTPHVIRSPHASGHTPMLRVEKSGRER